MRAAAVEAIHGMGVGDTFETALLIWPAENRALWSTVLTASGCDD